MNHLKTFENFNNETTLIVVDVQKSFKKFFTDKYLSELKQHCKNFTNVYQIWDNHVEGKDVDKDFLYHEDPEIPIHDDLYHFPNQKELIEKRYNYDVNVDFYKKILNKETLKIIKEKETNNKLKRGDLFMTTEGTAIVYIGNNHKWFHIPIKLYEIFNSLKGKTIEVVGGSSGECLLDVITAGQSIGVNMKPNYKFIYSASHCPIR